MKRRNLFKTFCALLGAISLPRIARADMSDTELLDKYQEWISENNLVVAVCGNEQYTDIRKAFRRIVEINPTVKPVPDGYTSNVKNIWFFRGR